MDLPNNYALLKADWKKNFRVNLELYGAREQEFLPFALPEDLLGLSALDVLEILRERYGSYLLTALSPDQTIHSPVRNQLNSDWLKSVNMVGVNIRTIGNFWNLIKYALTLPQIQSSIHILPIWEPGVVSSLYGISSWHINPEFFSYELQNSVPKLNTVEKQLKVVVNILHLMGKTVGMDVIPHTDRYSEIVLANPAYFEWLQRKEFDIINHSANLHRRVEQEILNWLNQYGSADAWIDYPRDTFSFFVQFPEEARTQVLFGHKGNLNARNNRRNDLISHLYYCGLEPVPATMGPPYRGLEVDKREEAKTVDSEGRIWRDYQIINPQKFSRAFGPLTRFKLYERLEDNQNWAVDFEEPRIPVWQYIKKKYGDIQATYNFDFMRGDMSHVQMRPNGVAGKIDDYYDLHRSIKHHIQQTTPHFGYFGETFLAPPDEMAYGVEEDHLELSVADTTLGDLQSIPVGTKEFLYQFSRYYEIGQTRSFTPNFTVMTADKDDPRFDSFYLHGNVARLFIAFFLDMPSYMGLGFESRDIHTQPAPNEQYTKLYVFQIDKGPKTTNGPYQWGQNGQLFYQLTRLKVYADSIREIINGESSQWLLPPDPKGARKVIAWTIKSNPTYIFIANLGTSTIQKIEIPINTKAEEKELWQLDFVELDASPNSLLEYNGFLKMKALKAGAIYVFKKEI